MSPDPGPDGGSSPTSIRDRAALAGTPARETALDCVAAGVAAAHPARVVPEEVALERTGGAGRLRVGDSAYDLAGYDEVVLLGAGKAAAGVAAALAGVLGDRLSGGIVVTDGGDGSTDGGDDPTDGGDGPGDGPADPDRVAVVPASHPVPDERGLRGAGRVLERARAAGEDTLALVVVTGGASALLPAPAGDLSLPDLRAVTAGLLDSGAPIADVNAVRKHCSRVKGGLLARELAPAGVLALALSDVVGDDPAVVGSGPTVGDPTTYGDALAALDRHGVDPPAAVRDHLRAGARGDRPETPAPGDPAVERADYHFLATNRTALAAARDRAREAGYRTLVLSDRVRGEAREAARTHAAVAESVLADGDPVDPPAVVLSGGETTVTVDGDGRGGPNAELALSAAVEFAARAGGVDVGRRAAVASVDTDGRDGPGDGPGPTPAGAVVDGDTVAPDDLPAARAALAAHDAHGYLPADSLVVTGPTGTNVDDLRVIVVTGADGGSDPHEGGHGRSDPGAGG